MEHPRYTLSHLHPANAPAPSSKAHELEECHPGFVREGLLRARDKTIAVMHEIRGEIREGITEDEARKLALKIFLDHGVKKHWHRPFIRLGPGTALTFNDPIQLEYRLREGDPFYLDLGPVWEDPDAGLEYEGDTGDTFTLGANAETSRCADDARELFALARKKWSDEALDGQAIYRFLATEASSRGYQLLEEVPGHRLSDFPHQKYSKERLSRLDFVPTPGLWVLEVQIIPKEKPYGAFFEDILGIG